MDARTKAHVEKLTRAALEKLRVALEDCKAGRLASASCEATEAGRIVTELNDELYTAAHAVYQWPEPPFQLPPTPPVATGPHPLYPLCPPSPFLMPMPIPPVHTKCIVVQCDIRASLPPHQDYTSAKILADAKRNLTE